MSTPAAEPKAERKKWSEDDQPWNKTGKHIDMGYSKHLGVGGQWAACILAVAVLAGYIGYFGLLPTGPATLIAPTVVYMLVWLMFWGIVSHKMNAEVKSFLITLPGVWVFMWWMDALLPYCIGWIAVWLCINMVWYADDKARSKVKADGSEGVPEKGEPYKWVYDGTKSILLYDFYPYATHCPNSIGVFNATCYILVRWCGLPGQYRWILTSFIAPTLLFIGGDLIPLLKKGGMSVEYRLNLMQCIRLWLMRIGLYSIIFYGFCYKVEELIITEIQGRGNATANEMGLGEI